MPLPRPLLGSAEPHFSFAGLKSAVLRAKQAGIHTDADLAASFARAAPLPHGSVVIGAMLADRCAMAKGKLTAGGIAAIGLSHNRSPWRALLTGVTDDDLDELTTHARDERCRLAWLDALGAGGTAVVRLDQRLRLWLAKLEAACASRRKSSHLRPLVLLAGYAVAWVITAIKPLYPHDWLLENA